MKRHETSEFFVMWTIIIFSIFCLCRVEPNRIEKIVVKIPYNFFILCFCQCCCCFSPLFCLHFLTLYFILYYIFFFWCCTIDFFPIHNLLVVRRVCCCLLLFASSFCNKPTYTCSHNVAQIGKMFSNKFIDCTGCMFVRVNSPTVGYIYICLLSFPHRCCKTVSSRFLQDPKFRSQFLFAIYAPAYDDNKINFSRSFSIRFLSQKCLQDTCVLPIGCKCMTEFRYICIYNCMFHTIRWEKRMISYLMLYYLFAIAVYFSVFEGDFSVFTLTQFIVPFLYTLSLILSLSLGVFLQFFFYYRYDQNKFYEQ